MIIMKYKVFYLDFNTLSSNDPRFSFLGDTSTKEEAYDLIKKSMISNREHIIFDIATERVLEAKKPDEIP